MFKYQFNQCFSNVQIAAFGKLMFKRNDKVRYTVCECLEIAHDF